jgi:hypothetical protein
MQLSHLGRWVWTALIAAGCSSPASPVVPVVAHDYAFAAPDTIAGGMTAFTLENRGLQPHEMFIGLLRPGIRASQIMEAAKLGTTFRFLPEVYLEGAMYGALFAWPGTTSPARLTVELVRGRSYILLCTLHDSTTAPQHAALGMFHLLQVK